MSTTIHIATIEEVCPLIIQFEEFQHSEEKTPTAYLEHMKGKKSLVLLATEDNVPAGFGIAYDRYGDGSFYCWRTGVLPQFRRKGILTAIMHFLEEWAKKQEYKSLKLFTRNSRREMLAFLIHDGFFFTELIPKETMDDYRIRAEKTL